METIDNAFDTAHKTVDKIAKAASHAAEALGEKGEELKNAEHRLMDNCQSYVRDNPIASVAIAVAAGFVMSRLLMANKHFCKAAAGRHHCQGSKDSTQHVL